MKLADLTVGQAYRTTKGEKVIVIDVGTPGNRWYMETGWKGGIRKGVGGSGSGVAVAKAHYQAGVPTWRPSVIQAFTIEFTEEAYLRNRTATNARRAEAETARAAAYDRARDLIDQAHAATGRTYGASIAAEVGGPIRISVSVELLEELLANQKEA